MVVGLLELVAVLAVVFGEQCSVMAGSHLPSQRYYITTSDGTKIYYKDWGSGPPVIFSHGWPLTADAFEDQMFYLAARGYRTIAHDRRGHGRSSQPSNGNVMNTYAQDLAALVNHLDLRDAVFVGHSTGGGEALRYVARYAKGRARKLVMISAVPPQMVKTSTNKNGLPISTFDDIRSALLRDRSQFFQNLTIPFYGVNKPGGNKVSKGLRDQFWFQGMMGGLKNEYDCVKAFSETDFNSDLKAVTIPTLLVHGDADQIVPLEISSAESVKILRNAHLIIYKGAPHGLPSTYKNRLNADLLKFIKS